MAGKTTRHVLVGALVLIAALTLAPRHASAQGDAGAPAAVAPILIPLTGQFVDANGQPRTGEVALVLSLYDGQDDPPEIPRYRETLLVTLDAQGRYEVQFGLQAPGGIPAEMFGAVTARWVGIGVDGQADFPRAMIVSVPYAAKAASAASADTIGGKSVSDLVLTSSFKDDVKAVLASDPLGASGLVTSESVSSNFLLKGDAGAATDSAVVYESPSGNIGIGTTTPSANLHIVGSTRFGTNDHATGGAMVDGVVRLAWGTGVPTPPVGLWSIWHESTDGSLRFKASNGATNLVIDDGGNVGIGASAPGRHLDVAGNVRARGFFEIAETDGSRNGILTSYKGLAGGGTDRSPTLFAETGNGLHFATNGSATQVMTITAAGNVGVGTSSPATKLHIVGELRVDGNIAAKYQDVAEWVDAVEPLEAGTVVIIDDTAANRVKASHKSYDTRVAGAISPQPGLVLGEGGEGRVLVAQSGRVRIKADARHGAIKPGDLLVTAPRAGYAMKSKNPKPGTVLGKALEPLEKGTGEILVLLTLQ